MMNSANIGISYNRSLSPGVIIIGIVIITIGLLNVVLGSMSIISGAFPGNEAKPIAPEINIGGIFFGLVMLIAGALWVISGTVLFTGRIWSSRLALYIAFVIVGINLLGVLNILGFKVNIGLAALSTVTGIASIWYLSKKDLASFFVISVIEHVFIIIMFAMIIYAEPMNITEPKDAIAVSLEEIKKEEKKEEKIIIKKKEPVLKKTETPKEIKPEKAPTLPKIEIQNVTAARSGSVIESSVPQLPRAFAQATDKGESNILRSPGIEGKERRFIDDLPSIDDKPVIYSSTKPSIGTSPSITKKEGSEAKSGNLGPRNIRESGTPSSDNRVGPSSGVARPGFVGDITGEVAGRKVIFWPEQLEEYKGTQGGITSIKFWVDPPGSVIKAEVSKKSGNPSLDRIAREYVLQIRFAELPKNFEQKTQWGEIIIRFELTRKEG